MCKHCWNCPDTCSCGYCLTPSAGNLKQAAELAMLRTSLEKAQRDNANLRAEFTKMPVRVHDLERQLAVAQCTMDSAAAKYERLRQDAFDGGRRAGLEAAEDDKRQLQRQLSELRGQVKQAYAAVTSVQQWAVPPKFDLVRACHAVRERHDELKRASEQHHCKLAVPYGKALRAADHLRRALQTHRREQKRMDDRLFFQLLALLY